MSNSSKSHQVSVYNRSDEVARGDCTCGWTTGLDYNVLAVARDAANHEWRTSRTTIVADRFGLEPR